MNNLNFPAAAADVIGISQIATLRPQWVLPNAWYDSLMARKFVKHTGIENRCVSQKNEVDLAVECVEQLQQQTDGDLSRCAGLVLVSPSLVPQSVARRYFSAQQARDEQPNRVARQLVDALGIAPRRTLGINGFCSGYARAMALVQTKVLPGLALAHDEFVLVVTSSRISRITDFACKQSGALFGDLATATLLSRSDNHKHPVRFELLDAQYAKKPTPRPFFHFAMKENVLVPTPEGGRDHDPQRVVFSLDGMAIADAAPRAMAAAAAQIVHDNRLLPEDIDCIVPHQAGQGIVRLAGMKLEEAGFSGELINGLTKDVGNVSSGSVPYALKQLWDHLHGTIVCPVAAVGAPGKSEVSQGCVMLRRIPSRQAAAA